MAYPSKMTADRCRAFVEEIAAGKSRSAAAKAIGVSRMTLYEWFERGRKGEEPFALLLEHVELAEESVKRAKVAEIRASLGIASAAA
jgi:transposase